MAWNPKMTPAAHSSRSRLRPIAAAVAVLALAAWTAGCRLHVEKGANGDDKKVQIDTPFGGIHVNTDQTTAADLGLPVYPGAELEKDDDAHKSADVHMGFGEWQLHVRVVTYGTADKQDRVVAYYKKALTRYGDVLTCQGNQPVGTPTVTLEGLTCNDKQRVQAGDGSFETGNGDLELKAGSVRHQHIVGFEKPSGGQTRFALVSLDLPPDMDLGSNKTD
jgi:hypothetical protein